MEIAKLKTISLVLALVGLVMFGAGWVLNNQISHEEIKTEFKKQEAKYGEIVPIHSSDLGIDAHDSEAHVEQGVHQVENKPWASLLMAAMLFFGLSAAILFFFAIQNAAQAGWSIVVLRIMQAIASYIPVGAVLLGIVVITAALHFGGNHLYHWMEPGLGDKYMMVKDGTTTYYKTMVEGAVVNPHYDFLTDSKSPFLNIPFWLVRIAIYFIGCTLFYFKFKSISSKLDETKSYKDQRKLYNFSVLYIVFFALASAAWAWDFLMSIDHHWYSTLFIWYTMVSCLVTGVAFTLIFSIYMNKQGKLPLFNDNHQHDLTKYLFGFSLLWSYLWFDQFMLQWYANIPEEVIYFLGRYKLYPFSYFWMLIPNLLLPLLVLVSSSIKRNSTVVLVMCCVVIFGHMWDFYNIVMPGTVGGFHSLGLLSVGAYLLVGGIFGYTVLTTLSKGNLVPEGNAYLHESEIYEYPY